MAREVCARKTPYPDASSVRNDPELVLRVALRYATSLRSVSAAKGYFGLNDLILYGKYKNHHGKIVAFGFDPKGNPTIEIEPIPKGRKQNKIMGLFKVWHDPPPALRLPQPPGIVAPGPMIAEAAPEAGDDEDDDEDE